MPVEDAEDLERFRSDKKRSFGSIAVTATIGQTDWQTSVFRDNKSNSYLLPIKASVRRKQELIEDETYEVTIRVE